MIGVVVRSLENMNPKVRARALGTMHNLSTDTSSIGIIRQEVWDLRLFSRLSTKRGFEEYNIGLLKKLRSFLV